MCQESHKLGERPPEPDRACGVGFEIRHLGLVGLRLKLTVLPSAFFRLQGLGIYVLGFLAVVSLYESLNR